MSKWSSRQLATAAIIAALYTVMSLMSSVFGLTYGAIQCRFSEALTVLPFFLPEADPGPVCRVPCHEPHEHGGAAGYHPRLHGNALGRTVDSEDAEQMAGAPATGHLQRCDHRRYDRVVRGGFGPGFGAAFAYNAVTVGIGEAIACYVLGMLLLAILPRVPALRGRLTVRG